MSVPNRNISGESEVLGLEDLIRARVVQDSLGVNTGFVREGTVATACPAVSSEPRFRSPAPT
jgi:hypothetical protein